MWNSCLKPADKEIHYTLETQSANLLNSGESLVDLISNEIVGKKENLIKELEHNGDALACNIFYTLDSTFITPLDKEDISRLAASIDSILDSADGAAERIFLFKIKRPIATMAELAKFIQSSANEIHLLVTKLENIKTSIEITARCTNISEYEHRADHIYRKAAAELFEISEPVEKVKMKEIYEALVEATDRCVDVADVIEDIVLKYK